MLDAQSKIKGLWGGPSYKGYAIDGKLHDRSTLTRDIKSPYAALPEYRERLRAVEDKIVKDSLTQASAERVKLQFFKDIERDYNHNLANSCFTGEYLFSYDWTKMCLYIMIGVLLIWEDNTKREHYRKLLRPLPNEFNTPGYSLWNWVFNDKETQERGKFVYKSIPDYIQYVFNRRGFKLSKKIANAYKFNWNNYSYTLMKKLFTLSLQGLQEDGILTQHEDQQFAYRALKNRYVYFTKGSCFFKDSRGEFYVNYNAGGRKESMNLSTILNSVPITDYGKTYLINFQNITNNLFKTTRDLLSQQIKALRALVKNQGHLFKDFVEYDKAGEDYEDEYYNEGEDENGRSVIGVEKGIASTARRVNHFDSTALPFEDQIKIGSILRLTKPQGPGVKGPLGSNDFYYIIVNNNIDYDRDRFLNISYFGNKPKFRQFAVIEFSQIEGLINIGKILEGNDSELPDIYKVKTLLYNVVTYPLSIQTILTTQPEIKGNIVDDKIDVLFGLLKMSSTTFALKNLIGAKIKEIFNYVVKDINLSTRYTNQTYQIQNTSGSAAASASNSSELSLSRYNIITLNGDSNSYLVLYLYIDGLFIIDTTMIDSIVQTKDFVYKNLKFIVPSNKINKTSDTLLTLSSVTPEAKKKITLLNDFIINPSFYNKSVDKTRPFLKDFHESELIRLGMSSVSKSLLNAAARMPIPSKSSTSTVASMPESSRSLTSTAASMPITSKSSTSASASIPESFKSFTSAVDNKSSAVDNNDSGTQQCGIFGCFFSRKRPKARGGTRKQLKSKRKSTRKSNRKSTRKSKHAQ